MPAGERRRSQDRVGRLDEVAEGMSRVLLQYDTDSPCEANRAVFEHHASDSTVEFLLEHVHCPLRLQELGYTPASEQDCP